MPDTTHEGHALDEVEKLKTRVHKLADMVQAQENRIAVQEVIIKTLGDRVGQLFGTMATGEQLHNAVSTIELKLAAGKMQLENAVSNLTDRVTNVHNDLAPIKRGVYWVVTLIIGAVILAVLGLVIVQRKP